MQRVGIRERHIVDPGVATSDLAQEASRLGHRACRADAGGHRLHRRRHDDARHAVSEHRLRAAGEDRRIERVGLRPHRRLLGLYVRADDGGAHRRVGRQPACAGRRRRRDVEHHRLHRPHDLRPVRRRRRARSLSRPATDDGIGILDFENYVDGSGGPALCMPAGGSRMPASRETVEQRLHFVKQDGQTVFKFAVRNMEEVCRRILERNGLKPHEIDLFVPHQASSRIILAAAEKLGLPREKVVINIDRFGNTTAGDDSPGAERRRRRTASEARRPRPAGVGRRRVHGRRRAPEVGAEELTD